jgi:hypothetical protein
MASGWSFGICLRHDPMSAPLVQSALRFPTLPTSPSINIGVGPFHLQRHPLSGTSDIGYSHKPSAHLKTLTSRQSSKMINKNGLERTHPPHDAMEPTHPFPSETLPFSFKKTHAHAKSFTSWLLWCVGVLFRSFFFFFFHVLQLLSCYGLLIETHVALAYLWRNMVQNRATNQTSYGLVMLIVSACWLIPWLNTCVFPNVFNVECEQVNEVWSCNFILTWLLYGVCSLILTQWHTKSNIDLCLIEENSWMTPTCLVGWNWQSLWFAIAKEMEQFSSMIQWTTLCCKAV